MYTINDLAAQQRTGAPFRLCATVHDSVLAYVQKDSLDEGIELIKKAMRTPAEKQFELPFEVDVKLYKDFREGEVS